MIAILKYNSGNIMSVRVALKRLGHDAVITDDPDIISSAEKVIIPGVGEAASAMRHLREKGLDRAIVSLRQPVLGICLGLQLMCASSEEGDTEGLGIFETQVRRFPDGARVPHMGWNDFVSLGDVPLFKGVETGDDVYYVHSYYAGVNGNTIAVCDYGLPFSAAMRKDNFYATQFHPEKSAATGARILKNFTEL
ncbi:MAG: imidazole glycerol phosphate synthase subunit HisH [Bacteroidales bacterium]|nr:imidazole glycerol phosphate synthase subunit HisH [Bacteroidales bacterium]MDT8373767.1 imidazole glycerol phosphate synthase subunit HisH [Bacteroidales bacterium]